MSTNFDVCTYIVPAVAFSLVLINVCLSVFLYVAETQRVMQTALSIHPRDFDAYTVGTPGTVDLTFCLKEFRVRLSSLCVSSDASFVGRSNGYVFFLCAVLFWLWQAALGFCEMTNSPMSLYFEGGGKYVVAFCPFLVFCPTFLLFVAIW